MGFFDTLFGRQKPVEAGDDKIFAMSTAQITLQTEQNIVTTGSAAVCFNEVESGPFAAIQTDLEQLLALASREDHLTVTSSTDKYGYRWLIFTGTDFQALVTAVHMASSTLVDRGYGSRLFFATFAFKRENGQKMYWMYNYKRSKFYPFVPESDPQDPGRKRDNAEELRLAAAMGKEMPIEQEVDRWFVSWNPPL